MNIMRRDTRTACPDLSKDLGVMAGAGSLTIGAHVILDRAGRPGVLVRQVTGLT